MQPRSRLFLHASALVLAVMVAFFSLCQMAMQSPAHAAASWNLLWNDEFDQSSIDTSHWSVMSGRSFYTPRTLETYLPSNANLQNGALVLHSGGTVNNYTSAGVSSRGKFAFLYGKIEWAVRVPQGQGLWPALWMMPDDGSSTYEIDALEQFGQSPATTLMTNHWLNADGHHQGMTTSYTGADLSQGYHTISVTWLPDELYWEIDGVIRKETTSHIPNVPMFIYMNTAIGGWAGAAAPALSSDFSIDYVRVYQQSQPTVTGGGAITSQVSLAPGKANLTTLGTLDWDTWGVTTVSDRYVRQNGGNQISDYGAIGSGIFQRSGGSGSTLTWTNGAFPSSGTNAGRGVVACGPGNGFVLTFPADQQTSVVHLYVNVWQGQGELDAFLADRGSAPVADLSLNQPVGGLAGVYTLTFHAPTAGDQLFVRWTVAASTPNACVVLQAATLSRAIPQAKPPHRKPTQGARKGRG